MSLRSLEGAASPLGARTIAVLTVLNNVNGNAARKGSDLKTQQQKMQRRLARKAEAARQSRKRKKEYVQSLEEKVGRQVLRKFTRGFYVCSCRV